MVRDLIWLSFFIALAAGTHGVWILYRRWSYFLVLGGLGAFLPKAIEGLSGQVLQFVGRTRTFRLFAPRLARKARRTGQRFCDRIDKRIFDTLWLPLLILSSMACFWWSHLAWINLHPDPSAVPWWKMSPSDEARELAMNFALYDVFHVSVVWIAHILIGARVSYFARGRLESDAGGAFSDPL